MKMYSQADKQSFTIRVCLQIKTNKVKELLLARTVFSHIPLPGLVISDTDKLDMQDCVFKRISPGSVSVKNVKEVEVMNNQVSFLMFEAMPKDIDRKIEMDIRIIRIIAIENTTVP